MSELNRMVESYPVLLAIDPSVNNLGWASYDFQAGGEMYNINGAGWKFGLIHPKGPNLQYKWKDCYFKLRRELEDRRVTHFAGEWPIFFGSMKGKIAAQQGYTNDLAGTIGYLIGKFQVKAEYVALWTPVQWKGSVPKAITEKKFIRVFGEAGKEIARTVSNDVIDAIMIAEFWLSLFNREKFSFQRARKNLIHS